MIRGVIRDRIDAREAHATIESVGAIYRASFHVISQAYVQREPPEYMPVVLAVYRVVADRLITGGVPVHSAAAGITQQQAGDRIAVGDSRESSGLRGIILCSSRAEAKGSVRTSHRLRVGEVPPSNFAAKLEGMLSVRFREIHIEILGLIDVLAKAVSDNSRVQLREPDLWQELSGRSGDTRHVQSNGRGSRSRKWTVGEVVVIARKRDFEIAHHGR